MSPGTTAFAPSLIAAMIAAAQAQCIDGFVINWYGEPVAGLGNASCLLQPFLFFQ